MQNANMAAALGVNPPRVYAVTFGIGAALSGLAGAVLAPVSGVFPTIGVAYVAKSFITGDRRRGCDPQRNDLGVGAVRRPSTRSRPSSPRRYSARWRCSPPRSS